MGDEEAGTACDLADLARLGAYLEGHFLLTTGRHSDRFFLLARLTEQPARMRAWAAALAERLAPYRPQAVVGPAVGGIIPAYATGAELGARVLYAEKTPAGGMALRRGFQLERGERVAVIEDAMTTGSSVAKVMAAVEAQGAQVVAVGLLVDRRPHDGNWPVPVEAVVTVRGIPAWEAEACPLCRTGVPLVRPKA
ncbi:Orotate phosphoribosyltransferase [Candidatus Hydrogenisulfobacillus filiaventi]|uniref:Orotate phosphoribosyltransferase n=1 Tax=Candidatus Hydrogenisulfobacillus filiaventi TaxID=2707344 RepID=A0A6F8ZES2_9FIRM|nr:orotate phosphoribosyltransferase [Bacillota bacterium]CAB1128496.1 Orotate phosphoribosyltransferase [Candidatus Hydrogenisulfobacillus filiaventi]